MSGRSSEGLGGSGQEEALALRALQKPASTPTLVIHIVPVLFQNSWPQLSAQSCHHSSSTCDLS